GHFRQARCHFSWKSTCHQNTQAKAFEASLLGYRWLRVGEGGAEPVLNLLRHALDAAIQLDAGPAKPAEIDALLLRLMSHVVVVHLLAAMLQQECKPH